MRLAEIQARIASMEELLRIVGAMRALASMRMQEAMRALASVRRYSAIMATALGDALILAPERQAAPRGAQRERRALVLCASEHGFVGGFNERLLSAVERDLGPADALFILGTRGSMLAEGRGRHALWACPMATRLASVPETIRRLTSELYRLIASGAVTRAHVAFARCERTAAPTIERRQLFPLELAPPAQPRGRLPPLHTLAPEALLERLIAEYLFAALTEAATESVASENVARFGAMESASDNVSKKLGELRQQGRQARQEEVTTELLDLVTGAEAAPAASR
jgi:F-type H+-transporting ATPase subunit gamma